jgi:transcription elongation factor Elf1
MSRKIFNCPHCGKILPKNVWEKKKEEGQLVKCPRCGSEKVWKNGFVKRLSGKVQCYLCGNCFHKFS